MTTTAVALKANLIDELIRRAEARLGEEAGSVQVFLRRFYSAVAPDDLLTRAEDDLLGAALGVWNSTKVRSPGEPSISVFNPTPDKQGWECHNTIVDIVNDDMPFLVDSVTNELTRRSLDVHLIIHPIIKSSRDDSGRRLFVSPTEGDVSGFLPESCIHIEIDRVAHDWELEDIRCSLQSVLSDVRSAVEDWKPMRSRIREIIEGLEESAPHIPKDEIREIRDFLSWLDDDFFTYLGYREYTLSSEGPREYVRPIEGSGLGILRELLPKAKERAEKPITTTLSEYAHRKNLLLITKAHSKSTVHRNVHLDYVGIKTFDQSGEVTGEKRILGLFTSSAYNQSVRRIPLIRSKVEGILARSGLSRSSHDGKALVHILETYPRDELFQISEDELLETTQGILQLQDRQRLALFVRKDDFEHFVSCQVFVPRDRYTTELREKLQKVLEKAFNGVIEATFSHLGDSPLARWCFVLRTDPGKIPVYDLKQIENQLVEISRTWSGRLRNALCKKHGEPEGLELHRSYRDSFPTAYREAFSADTALADIDIIETSIASGELGLDLYRPAEQSPQSVNFKIFHEGSIPLSGILPILENMGFTVASEVPYRISMPKGRESSWIRDFGLESQDGEEVRLHEIRDLFQEAFARVWLHEVENDQFNLLVLTAGLSSREVEVLRAYARYLVQIEITYSLEYMARTLYENRGLTRLLIRLFTAKFDPDLEEDRAASVETIARAFHGALEEVQSLDADRILFRLKNLILSTVRTNFYQQSEQGHTKPYLSFKIDSHQVVGLPEPRPLHEIYVYSTRFEAVHLRGGGVARGGIRWSDRQEDLRTEILGLLKAQMVKNAVIVPVGAKGGFVLRRRLATEELRHEGETCYRMMIGGMLDVTDNLVGGEIQAPAQVICWDDPDPYLVVAADKGTATFSDIANDVAASYGFWLEDAFASGGSAGYDHKRMGITARGTFVSVQRHFHELGINPLEEETTVVGIGDMSGDVFGNGLLQSSLFKLVGAFNHEHIFIDPNPDPEVSFKERERLFGKLRSKWTDYTPSLISDGGGVFDRAARAIPVTPSMRERFQLDVPRLTPDELIQALLRAQVDLLWFGGIGTYVKATTERHFETGDRANDAVRVNASDLGCKVIGEGANLGLTQLARIEFALAGGRVNTDAIDNSAGVSTSDREVNIKLALGSLTAAGEMTRHERDELLESMTDEVAELVLRDNYHQTQAISIAEHFARRRIDRQLLLMRSLENEGKLNRELEFLPDDKELLRREASGSGLTRPEISVLLAYCKIDLFDELLKSELPDDPMLADDLVRYFPEPLRRRCRTTLVNHRLRREIIATYATNSMINRVGPSFVRFLMKTNGASVNDIARSYIITRDAFDLRALWEAIEALDYEIKANVQTRLLARIGDLVEQNSVWILHHLPRPLDLEENLNLFGYGLRVITGNLLDMLPATDLERFEERVRFYEALGLPGKVAHRMASIDASGSAFSMIHLARTAGRDAIEVGRVLFELADRFQLNWLREAVDGLPAESPWQKAASAACLQALHELQADLARCFLESDCQRIEDWLTTREGVVRRTDIILEEIRGSSAVDLSMLNVANYQLGQLVAG